MLAGSYRRLSVVGELCGALKFLCPCEIPGDLLRQVNGKIKRGNHVSHNTRYAALSEITVAHVPIIFQFRVGAPARRTYARAVKSKLCEEKGWNERSQCWCWCWCGVTQHPQDGWRLYDHSTTLIL
ncbi:hypothetical protein J6590_027024 [Homalodisca vitripennis]|nr:hypothetical protein J6590_027024 [Homalodisca vitripennis]